MAHYKLIGVLQIQLEFQLKGKKKKKEEEEKKTQSCDDSEEDWGDADFSPEAIASRAKELGIKIFFF